MKLFILTIGGIYLVPSFLIALTYPLYKVDGGKGNIFTYAKSLYKGN